MCLCAGWTLEITKFNELDFTSTNGVAVLPYDFLHNRVRVSLIRVNERDKYCDTSENDSCDK